MAKPIILIVDDLATSYESLVQNIDYRIGDVNHDSGTDSATGDRFQKKVRGPSFYISNVHIKSK